MEMADAVAAIPSNAGLLPEKMPPQAPKADAGSQPCSKDGIQRISPVLLKVPKSFNFPERYMSPTDRIISPISKNLLARNRRAGSILPPTINPSKDAAIFRT